MVEFFSLLKQCMNRILIDIVSYRSAQKMLTCVVMPRLPRNALVEWHAVATQQLPKSECKLPSLLFSETYCIID